MVTSGSLNWRVFHVGFQSVRSAIELRKREIGRTEKQFGELTRPIDEKKKNNKTFHQAFATEEKTQMTAGRAEKIEQLESMLVGDSDRHRRFELCGCDSRAIDPIVVTVKEIVVETR